LETLKRRKSSLRKGKKSHTTNKQTTERKIEGATGVGKKKGGRRMVCH